MKTSRIGRILLIVFGLPIFGTLLSCLTATGAEPLLSGSDGIGDGKNIIVVGAIIYGVLGIILSLVIGPLVALLSRKAGRPTYACVGYLLPSLAAFLFVTYGFISVVILGHPRPY